jgi:hypothetical protein
MHAAVTIREASVSEIPEIVRLRRCMYEDMNYKDANALQTMSSLTANFLSKAIPDGTFRAWLALDSNRVIAGAAVIITPWPSLPLIWNAAAPRFSTSTPIPTTADVASRAN